MYPMLYFHRKFSSSVTVPQLCEHLTINTTVLFIDQQAHQGRLKREGKESVGEHLTST